MTYSRDVGEIIVVKWWWYNDSMTEIARQLLLDRRTVSDRIDKWLNGESLVLNGAKGSLHHDRLNSAEVLNAIAAAVDRNETIYLTELADVIEEEIGVRQSEAIYAKPYTSCS